MNRFKEINQQFEGSFDFFDYHITHSQLLLRCSNFSDGSNTNTDLKFELVRYFELPQSLNNPSITNGTENDWEYIQSRYNSEVVKQAQHLFKIESDEKYYYILAGSCVVEKNNLSPEKSSITALR